MQNKIQRIVAYLLLLCHVTPHFAGIAVPLPQTSTDQANYWWQDNAWPQNYPSMSVPQSLTLSSEQFGIAGPFSAAGNYSDLTGAFVSGQYLKRLTEKAAISFLGEYGEKQWRLSATGGGNLAVNSLFKLTVEHFRQKLPFSFDSGGIEQWVGQTAAGFRLQNDFNHFLLNNINFGGYFAKAQNIDLVSKTFISNGLNCAGFGAGLQCINDRNIAGATSLGVDAGVGSFITAKTFVEGKVYYDRVYYNTIFSVDSIYNKNGFGGGLNGQQLLGSQVKLTAGAELRKVYDTYNLALSWLPPLASNSEVSLMAQRVVSHNQTPNNDLIGLQFTFLTDRNSYERREYHLTNKTALHDVGVWVKEPAVKMLQVLAISEQVTRLVKPLINLVIPNNGPLAGGNTVIITGSNFPQDVSVSFGNKLALVTSVSADAIKVIVPGVSAPSVVDVAITMPDNQVVNLPSGYIYTNSNLFPVILSLSPNIGHINGVFGAIIIGSNFLPSGSGLVASNTLVHLDNLTIIPTEVTPTTITFDIPAHVVGNVVVNVSNKYGTSNNLTGGFTYITEPTVASLTPQAGPVSGLTVTLTGSGFIAGNTLVNFDGTIITPTNVTPTSLTFVAPPHALGTVNITVTTPAGTSTTVSGGFTYIAAPTVSMLTPAIGHVSGVVGVSLSGSNFVPGSTSVMVDGIAVTPSLVTATSLVFNAPAHAAGVVPVAVTTPAGISANVVGGFTYDSAPSVTSLTPAAAPLTGQSGVVLSGSGFIPGNTLVNFAGLPLMPTAVTPTTVTFDAPAHAAGTVAVSVTTPIGTSPDVSGGFTYVAAVPGVGMLSATIIPLAGQTAITLSGSDFIVGNTTVNVDGIAITPTSVTPTTLTFNAPAHAAGTVAVNVTTSGGTSTDVVGGLTYAAAPTVGSITPNVAPLTGMNGVVINGSGFLAGNTMVNFAGTLITPTAVTATSITFDAPAHAAGTVAVSVSTPVGTSANVSGGFIFADTPQVTTLSPTIIPLTGSTGLTITGSGFVVGHTTVTIDGVPITPSLVTPTSITFDAPTHSAGTVTITVTTPGGTSGNVAGGLTYTAAPTVGSLTPSTVPVTGATGVILTGTGFIAGHTTINFDGAPITPSALTPTSLTFDAPAHAAGTVSISVTTPAGTSANLSGGFVYAAIPTVNSLMPAIIPVSGLLGLTLSGSNFVVGDTIVNVDGQALTPTSITATQITFDAPGHAAGMVTLTVTTAGGTSNNLAGGLTYAEAPTVGSLTPTQIPLGGFTGLSLTGTGFIVGNTTVNIDGVAVIPTAVTPTAVTFNAPGHNAGTVTINVTTPAGVSANVGGGLSYIPLPTVGVMTPAIIPVSGLIGITLSGTGFVPGNTVVNVNGTPITPTAITATSVTFDVPAHTAGTVTVNVTTPGGSSTDVAGGLTYANAPTATTLSPQVASLAGVSGVSLAGTGFIAGNTVVNFAGVPIVPSAVTPTSLTFDAPPHAAGTVAVNVTTPAGTSANVSGGFTYVAVPTVGTLTPTIVPLSGLTGVTLSGTGFVAGYTTVNVDGVPITPTLVTPTAVTFDVPAHAAGAITINVTTPGGTSTDVTGGLTYSAAPTLTAISPAAGPLAGLTGISLNGSDFIVGNTFVNVDGIPVTPTAITATSLTFDAPAHAAGTVTISVTTPAGTSANLTGGFIYAAVPTGGALTPAIGNTAGVSGVVLSGSNFVAGNTTVLVDGSPITPTAVTATSLTFDAPAHAAGNVSVSVATPGGSANVAGGFTYINLPTVNTLTPAITHISGSTGVTLSGSGFVVGNTTINFDGSPIIPTNITPTLLTFDAPAHAVGTITVNITTPAGTSGDVSGGFTYVAVPTVNQLSPALIPLTGATGVSLTGTGFVAGNTLVNVDGVPLTPTVITPTSITFDVPAHAAGTVVVNVTTPGGTSSDVSGGLTYVAVPTVNVLTPSASPLGGLTGITLTGTGFVNGNTSVNVDGIALTPTAVTPTSLTFDAPAHAQGTVAVSVTTPGGTSANVTTGLTYAPSPTASAISPNAASLAGVTGVTITGTHFIANNTTVNFDGSPITPTAVTPTSLTFDAPAHAAGNVLVSVTTPAGTTANIGGGFTYIAAPTVNTLTPNILPLGGAVGVSLTGTHFVVGDTVVHVDGVALTPTVTTATTITFDVPAHAAGTVSVNVTTTGGTSADVAGGLTFAAAPTVSAITPHVAPLSGVANITLTGTGFITGQTTVNFAGSPITPTTVTATSLTFDAPAHAAGTVSVSVTTPAGTSANVGGGFTYAPVPTVTLLTPTIVPLTGLTGLTLTGSGFISGETTVNVDGSPLTPTAVTPTSLTFDVPAHAAGTVIVNVTTPGGTSSDVSGGLTYAAGPTVTLLTPHAAPLAGVTGVTLTGTGFINGNTTIIFDGSPITPSAVTATSLTFDAPAHAAGTVTVSVTTPAGSSSNVGGGFTYAPVPTVTALTPAIIHLNGHTGITLTGSDFLVGNTTVNVGGVAVTPTAVAATSLTFDAPAHAAGTVTVNVTTPGGTSANVSGGLTYAPTPTVSVIAPQASPLTGTVGVTLTGTGFIVGNTTVNFDGSPLTPTAVTATSLTFNAPAHAAGTVNVSVTTPAGTSANVSGGFTYASAPTVSGLTPAYAPLSGLTNVVVTGTNFIAGNTTVTVDGSPITPTAVTATSATFDVPAHAAGTVTVSVTTPVGTSGNVSGGLTYVAAPTVAVLSPSAAPLTGTNGVTLSGTNFIASNTTVNFDGSPITPTAVTATSLTFNAPAHAAGAVTVSVTTPGGTSTNVSSNFTYVAAPTAGTLTPTMIPLSGYTGLTLTGTNFVAANTTVSVDGVTVTPTAVTATSLTFNAAAHAAGNVTVSVTTPAGTANVSGGLTYVAAPTVSTLNPSAAPLAGLNGITLSGTGFITGNTTVNFDGSPITPTAVTATSLTFNAPAHTAGSVNVSVTTPGGTSANVSGGFIYAAAPTVGALSPVYVPLSGYVGVTLGGTNFIVNNTTVNVDGSPITPTAVTSTSTTFNVPAHAAGTVTVNVTTPAGTSGNVSGGLTYLAAPTVGVLSPSSGSLSGVTGVTLSGTNFVAGNTTVNFDGSPITPTAVTSTSLTFDAPAHAAGTVTVSVTTPVGTSANVSGGFTYAPAPNISSCSYPGGGLSTAWLCVGTNMNAFTNTYINVQGGLTCTLGATISLLTTTIKTATNLGGNTILPGLYLGCTVKLCNNSTCTGLQSNVVTFS